MRSGSGGLVASLGSADIGLPPIVKWGSEAMKQRVVPEVLRGDKIAALAITEPSGGSDVANIRTRAVSDGDHYRAHIIDESFRGLPRVRQHQKVYAALGAKMGGELHALALETSAPEQG